MSSARIAPIPRSPSSRSQPWPALLERGRARASCPPASAAAGSARRRRAVRRASRRASPRPARGRSRRSRAPTRRARDRRSPPPLRRRSRKRSARSTSVARAAPASGRATRTTGCFAAASARSSSSVELDVADRERQSNVASAAVESRPLETRWSLVAVRLARMRARRAHPRRRQQHRHAALLELRHQLAQEDATRRRRRARRWSARRRRTRSRARRGAARARRAARARSADGSLVAHEGERRPSPPSQSSDAGRRSVGSSSACSHSSSTSVSVGRRLVEMQADLPRRLRICREAPRRPSA